MEGRQSQLVGGGRVRFHQLGGELGSDGKKNCMDVPGGFFLKRDAMNINRGYMYESTST